MEQKEEYDKALSSKEAELAERDKVIEQLKAKLANSETERKLAISEAVQEKERRFPEK